MATLYIKFTLTHISESLLRKSFIFFSMVSDQYACQNSILVIIGVITIEIFGVITIEIIGVITIEIFGVITIEIIGVITIEIIGVITIEIRQQSRKKEYEHKKYIYV